MRKVSLILIMFFIMPGVVNAQRGCCSHHGGVSGCSSNGRQVCNDGTLSPSCACTPSNTSGSSSPESSIKKIYGCTDKNAINYAIDANVLDNSCQYKKEVTETKKIKFKTKYKKNENTYVGTKKVIRKGKYGKKYITYSIIYDSSNNELSREQVKEEVIEKPVNKIVENGTKKRGFFWRIFN